jgi:hypothetical protein
MRNFWNILLLGMLALALTEARAQDTPAPPPQSQDNPASQQDTNTQTNEQTQPQGPLPAYGQDTTQTPMTENPPLSGLDLPSLEPHAAPLSYLQPGATVTESVDSNIANALGNGETNSVTRALGSLTLRRLWSHYDLGLDYVGGAGYYNVKGEGFRDLQQMDVVQRVTWKRGEFSVRDSFSYLPEGNFGGSYGSLGSEGVASLGSTSFSSFWGGSALGALGQTPRILNVSLAELEETLTPKSALTAIGGYAFTHFYGSGLEGSFISGSQVSAQGGYSRVLTSHTQVAVVFGYQAFDFSVLGSAFHTYVSEGLYGHRISGRMDLLLGAGPQVTFLDTPAAVCSNPTVPLLLCQLFGDTLTTSTVKNTRVGVAAQARLRYQLPKWSLSLMYERFETSGAGVFAGAQTDVARLEASRPLSRVWNVFGDLGYTHNSRLQPLTVSQVNACTGATSSTSQDACPANNATAYNYGFIGGGVHRSFGRSFHAFLTYQINEFAYDGSFCLTNSSCSRISNRQVATVGLDWTPRPIRID